MVLAPSSPVLPAVELLQAERITFVELFSKSLEFFPSSYGGKKESTGIMRYQFLPMTLSHLCSSYCCVFSSTSACLHQNSSVKRNSVSCPASSQLNQADPWVCLFLLFVCVQHCVHRVGAAAVELQGQKRVQLTVHRARIAVAISTLLSSSCVTTHGAGNPGARNAQESVCGA